MRNSFEKIIPVGKKQFAYQREPVSFPNFKMTAWLPTKGMLPYPNAEKEEIERYEFEITKFTGNSFEVCLYKIRKDGVKISHSTTFDFADFMNAIFKGEELIVLEKIFIEGEKRG